MTRGSGRVPGSKRRETRKGAQGENRDASEALKLYSSSVITQDNFFRKKQGEKKKWTKKWQEKAIRIKKEEMGRTSNTEQRLRQENGNLWYYGRDEARQARTLDY
jgi:hypothetical protein